MLKGPKVKYLFCDIIKTKLVIFNLSKEIKIEDLIGRLGFALNFKFIPGSFTEAFEKGYLLLLNEVNLGQKSVLQCMETALDTGKIEQDIPGCGKIKVKCHPDFILVATQNPFTNQIDE